MDRMTGIETQAHSAEAGPANENRSNLVHWLIAGLLGISRMEAEQIAGAAAHLANGLKRRARAGAIGRNSVLKAIEVVFFLVSLGASSASADTLTVTGTVDYRGLHPTLEHPGQSADRPAGLHARGLSGAHPAGWDRAGSR